MTYKIIIGDIDVTECDFRLERDNQQKCECCHATGFGVICDCEKWNNCYFKQLEQVKQENKRLLEIINAKPLETVDVDSAFEIEKLKEQLQAKEQECEELKTIINKSAEKFANDYLETFEENKKLKTQLMQKSEVDMFFSTPIEGWDNDPCKICQYKQDYKQKEQECETLKSENFTFEELVKYQDEQLEPFNGGYFEHLDTKMIADLAKKSIRLTTENRKLENALDEIERYFDKRCDICREQDGLELDCNFCWKKDIKDIINKAKEQENAR
jgi:hypothetical protein